MTPAERANPKIINGSRRARIAKGSGVTVSEVNGLVDRFFEARKMMKQMATRRRHARDAGRCPGMRGAGGKRAKAKQSRPRRARAASGAPATPPRRPRSRRRDAGEGAAAAGGNPFGHPGGEEIDYEKAAAALDLPKDFSKYLK